MRDQSGEHGPLQGALIPGRQPRTHIVDPKLALIEKHLSELDAVLRKLVRCDF